MKRDYPDSKIPQGVIDFRSYVEEWRRKLWHHCFFREFSINIPTAIHRANLPKEQLELEKVARRILARYMTSSKSF